MIRRILAGVAFLIAAALPASAMQSSAVPPAFPLAWGQNAGSGFIRTIPSASQIGIQNGAASLNDGFPPLTFTPIAAGGVPPFGQDFNGILNQLSLWTQWQNVGSPCIPYSAGLSSSIGGYPAGATLCVAGKLGSFWFNTTEANSTNPDSGGAGWILFSPTGGQTRSLNAVTGSWTLNVTDGTVGVVATGAGSTTLPAGASNGQVVRILDVGNNFNTFNQTVAAPTGQTIAGLSSVPLNVNGQNAAFTYFSSISTWGFNFPAGPPVGSIQIAAYGTADAGYLLAFGQCVSTATYAQLSTKLGTTFNSQDGCTGSTVGLPDLRGRAAFGQDNMGGTAANRITSAGGLFAGTTLGATGGVQSRAVNQANLASFGLPASASASSFASVNDPGHSHGIPCCSGANIGAQNNANVFPAATGGSNTFGAGTGISVGVSTSVTPSVSSGGSGTPLPTLSPAQILIYEIKF